MLTYTTTHLYLTWKIHHGTCKDEIGSPLQYPQKVLILSIERNQIQQMYDLA